MMIKKLLFFISLLSIFNLYAEVEIPQLTSPVVDHADFLSNDQEQALNNKIQSIYQKSKWQPQILTIETLDGESIEQFSIRVADEWKLGSKNKDNGLIIIVSKQERKTRIEVGSGLEGVITDYQAHQIIQDILIPEFKNQNFSLGFLNALNYIDSQFGDTPPAVSKKIVRVKSKPEFAGLFSFVFFILISFLFSFSRRRSRVKKHSWLRGLISAALFSLPFLAMGLHNLIFLGVLAVIGFLIGFLGFHQAGSYSSGSYHRSGWGGGFGSGGSSSWGGGGGGFSGGGASGDW